MIDLLRRASARRSRFAWVGSGVSSVSSVSSILAALVLFASTPAHAFCRTVTQDLPPDYSPTKGCFTDGFPLFWGNACVGYTINRKASSNLSLAEVTPIIDKAFAAWTSVTCPDSGAAVGIQASNLGPVDCDEVQYNKYVANQNLIVFRDTEWPYSDPNNTLGLTTVTFSEDTGELYDADMEINDTGKNLTISDTVPTNGYDLLSVITHEAGHFFGLAHATDSKSTMFASYKPGTLTLRDLAPDDVEGICTIYPNASTRAVASTISGGTFAAAACDPTPRRGLSNICEVDTPPSEGGCAVGPSGTESSPIGTSCAVGLALGLVFAVRRRCGRM